EPLSVDDYDQWTGRSTQIPKGAICSVAGVPLKSGPQTIGVLGLAYAADSQRRFGPEEIEMLKGFGQIASLALDNARLFARERAAREELERIHAATRALTTTMDVNEVLARLLEELKKVVAYDSASIQILKGDYFEIYTGAGFPNLDELVGVQIPVD